MMVTSKDVTPKKEVASEKRLDTGKNRLKRLSFDNKGTFVFCYIPFTQTALLQCLL